MDRSPFSRAWILTGPTGVGKSAISLRLAERLDAEIVSADSMALYRRMDILTAKPTAAERARVPHHLLDVLDPAESASVAWWLERALACCREIEARGKKVLVVGGTPLYLKAILHGLFDGPAADRDLRARLEARPAAELHRELAAVDPLAAAKLHVNDVRRVVRALEVWHLTGQPLSQLQEQWTEENRLSLERPILCLDRPRAELYSRIDRRVRQMIEQGLVAEVEQLVRLPLSREAQQAVGVNEIAAFLRGESTLDNAVCLMQTRTRQFAKRQLTWFRHWPELGLCSEQLTFAAWGLTMENETSN